MNDSIKEQFLKKQALSSDALEKVTGGIYVENSVERVDVSCSNSACLLNKDIRVSNCGLKNGQKCPVCGSGTVTVVILTRYEVE